MKKIFEEELARLLHVRGWPIKRLAEKSRVPTSTIHGWLNGRNVQSLDQLGAVATVLEISLHRLIFGTPDPFAERSEESLQEIFSGDVRVTIHQIKKRDTRDSHL